MGKRVVIIGGDAAGMSAASRLKRLDPEWQVTVYEAGEFVSYAACGIPYYVGGAVERFEDLVQVTPEEFIEKRKIDLHLRHRVTKILPDEHLVEVRDEATGETFAQSYDKLVIATGARAVSIPVPGLEGPRVVRIAGLPSARRIKEELERGRHRRVAIIGAGFIGLEMSEAFRAHGVEVTLIERLPLAPPAAEPEMSELIVQELEANGVRVLMSKAVTRFEDGDVPALVLEDGERVPADMVLVAAGVAPVSDLAKDAGIELGVRGAIAVDRKGRTSAADVYAAGDCAEVYHRLLGRNVFLPLALAANRMGRTVGEQLAGLDTSFPGALGTATVKVFELNFARTGLGLDEAKAEGYDAIKQTVTHGSRAHYYPGGSRLKVSLIFDRKTGKVLGGQMAGRDVVSKRIDVLATAITAGMTVPDVAGLDLTYAPPFSPVYDPVVIAAQVGLKKLA